MAIALYTLIFGATLAVFAEAQQPLFNCNPNEAFLKPSPRCGSVFAYGLNRFDIQRILDAFQSNNYRQLTWSDELAHRAQAWVNQCRPESDPCSQNPGIQPYEIFTTDSAPYPAAQIIESYEETHQNGNIMDDNADSNNKYPFLRNRRMAVNYYRTVGCGFIASEISGTVHHHILCYFGTSGNMNG